MKKKAVFLFYVMCVVTPLYCAEDRSHALEKVHIDEVPDELLVTIFEQLDARSFDKSSLVCKRWHAVAAGIKNVLLNKHTRNVCYAHEYQDCKWVTSDDSDLPKSYDFDRIFDYEAAFEDVISNGRQWAFNIIHDRHPKACVALKENTYFPAQNKEENFFHFIDARSCSTSNSDEQSEDDMRIVMGDKYYIEAAQIDCNYVDNSIESFQVLPSAKIHWYKSSPVIVKALRSAALRGNFKAVKYLVSKGANYRSLDAEKASLLHLACKGKSAQVVQCFIDKGLPIDAVDINNYPPLAWAYWSGNYRGASCIIEARKKQLEKDVDIYDCSVKDKEEIVRYRLKDFIHAQCNKQEIDEHFSKFLPTRSATRRAKADALVRKYLED